MARTDPDSGLVIDPLAVGRTVPPYQTAWTSSDALLYALGVGAGTGDLQYTTENSHDHRQRVLPTFGLVVAVGSRALPAIGDFDATRLVHARQRLTLHQPLPVEGSATVTERVHSIIDKGAGGHAIVTTAADATDTAGRPLLTSLMTVLLRGQGGFGGDSDAGEARVSIPDRLPDTRVVLPTRVDQALLYRLSGDRNPLHSDPWFAAKAGFSAPILHGLCTYGVAARALLNAVAGDEPDAVHALDASFTSPVYPGQDLTVNIWSTDGGARFTVTATPDGRVVLNSGAIELQSVPTEK